MILDELTLANFGVYRGAQTFRLTPAEGRPVILIGAQNGGGKTTFLEGLQLAFFGKLSPTLQRRTGSYEDHLKRMIHRGGDDQVPTMVQVRFRRTVEGRTQSFEVTRSWAAHRSTVKESFDVTVDGASDRVLTTHWAEYVEEMLPPRIAPLFFFDGEKIEQFAEVERSSEIIGTAISALLGLDIVDRLETDLDVFARRKAAEISGDEVRGELQQIVSATEVSEAAVQVGRTTLAGAVAQRDRRIELLDRAQRALKAQGGDTFAARYDLDRRENDIRKALELAERNLREWAGEVAPLLLVEDLLRKVAGQARAEEKSDEARSVARALEKRDSSSLQIMRSSGVPENVVGILAAFWENDRKERQQIAGSERYLGLTGSARQDLYSLSAETLKSCRDEGKRLVADIQALIIERDDVQRQLAAVPASEIVAPLLAAVEAETAALSAANEEVSDATAALQHAENALNKARALYQTKLEVMVQAQLEEEDTQRLLNHSSRVRETLTHFRRRIVRRHIGEIERHVLRCMRQLLRKEALIGSVEIDPATFAISLNDGNLQAIGLEQLSAGERQLFAIALLWSLARASGQEAPTVIDTPMGRLDSVHRTHLVNRYFPQASKQVILLSTDEEISGQYLALIEPHLARSMTISFDAANRCSRVDEGYNLNPLLVHDREVA